MPRPKDGWPAEDIWTLEWLLKLFIVAVLIAVFLMAVFAGVMRYKAHVQLTALKRQLRKKSPNKEPKIVGFFHPSW